MSDVNITISASDQNADAVLGKLRNQINGLKTDADKLAQSQKEDIAAMERFKLSIIAVNQAMQIAQQVYRTVKQVVDETVGAYVKYADQVRTLQKLNGTSAEQTSRLIQITDDYKISTDALTMATRKLSEEGLSLTVETLAKLSEEYLSLGTSAEKAQFLLDKFGRSGFVFAEIMEQGADAIRSQSAAINDNLILTQQSIDKAREYEKALDSLNDATEALKIEIGQGLTPVLIIVTKALGAFIDSGIPAFNLFFSGHFRAAAKMAADALIEFGLATNIVQTNLYGLGEGFGDWNIQIKNTGTAIEITDSELIKWNGHLKDSARLAEMAAEEYKRLIKEIDWEVEFSKAKNGAERLDSALGMLKEGLYEMGQEGAMVWQMMLRGMGKISPEALKAYINIQKILATIKEMIAKGISTEYIAAWAQVAIEGVTIVKTPTDWVFQGTDVAGFSKGDLYWSPSTGQYSIGKPLPPETATVTVKTSVDTISEPGTLDPLESVKGNIADIKSSVEDAIKLTVDDVQALREINNVQTAWDALQSKTIVLTILTAGSMPGSGYAGGGAFRGWGMVGDAPGGKMTPYTEFVYAPGGAVVLNQAQMAGKTAPPMASGGTIPPMRGEVNITINNPVPRSAEESMSRELLKLNYLGAI